MNTIALELYEQFKRLEASFTVLLDQTTTEAQRERLRACYVQGWRNYNLAVGRAFDMNDELVQQLHLELVAQGDQLTAALADMGQITDTINAVAKVIAFGATIALA